MPPHEHKAVAPAAGQSRLTASGDNAITGILLQTRAIIGSPKMGVTSRRLSAERAMP
jgi:hypothetical protein